MNKQQLEIVLGGLLHDTGKVLYRASDPGDHSQSGYDFLKDEVGIGEEAILDQVLYHHASRLRNAKLSDSSPAYITYIADNIASASDRRKKDESDQASGFDKEMALTSIFNILNGNHENLGYQAKTLDPKDGINYPVSDASYNVSFYKKIRQDLKDSLRNLEFRSEYVNSLLEILEADLFFIPSSTNKNELADISLYDHVKLTAAVGSCIYEYTLSKGITDLKTALYKNSLAFYREKVFLLFSMDMSGIQAFIYNQYGNEDVLKNLRSRSFYLEMMMETMIDDLLEGANLSRANLIYSGGGHAYLLLPNTEEMLQYLTDFEKRVNNWLLEQYHSDLYVAFGYRECSSDELSNKQDGSYREVFRGASEGISEQKRKRYSAEELLLLNQPDLDEHERECRICHRSDHLTKDNLCRMCSGLIHLSRDIMGKEFFSVFSSDPDGKAMPLSQDRFLTADTESSLRENMKSREEYVRTYSKNVMYTGQSLSTKLWVGDYCSAQTLEDLVAAGTGIRKLGVLRADVDNLGQAFVAGFPQEYETLSRSAAFSRKLSVFFKLHINGILKHGKYSLTGEEVSERNAAIIYSGGDDVFVVGAWKDVLEFAVDLRNRFKEFTQDTLRISAGFGLYHPRYPISYIASQTGSLEEYSKDLDGKNAITLFDRTGRYDWDTFIDSVLGEKFRIIHDYFEMYAGESEASSGNAKGKAFLYRILDLFRTRYQELNPLKYGNNRSSEEDKDSRINLARMAYMLARTEPDKHAGELEKEMYRSFSRNMYQWMKDPEDSRQAVTAIYLYAYLVRSEEE